MKWGQVMHAKEIKPGSIVMYQGVPVIIESVHVQTPSARGAATLYKFRGRNALTRQKLDLTLKGTDELPEADFHRRPVKLMYSDPTHIHLLDETDFNQYSLPKEAVEHELPYLTETLEGVLGLILDGECVGIQLPTAVVLRVDECDPAVRGNSATARTKPAKLETGLVVQVPEYISPGELIKVDTRTGEFLSRA
jgi:elongation factor P